MANSVSSRVLPEAVDRSRGNVRLVSTALVQWIIVESSSHEAVDGRLTSSLQGK